MCVCVCVDGCVGKYVSVCLWMWEAQGGCAMWGGCVVRRPMTCLSGLQVCVCVSLHVCAGPELWGVCSKMPCNKGGRFCIYACMFVCVSVPWSPMYIMKCIMRLF